MMMFLGMTSSAISAGSFWRRHGALGGVLAHDVLVQRADDLARRQLVEGELLFFLGGGEIDGHVLQIKAVGGKGQILGWGLF
jgi:hypothetical protein